MSAPNDPLDPQLMALASDARIARDAAARWFLAQGEQGIALLLRGLQEDRLGLMAHRRILLILGELGREETIPVIREALHRALQRDDPIVRSGAMEALAAFYAPEAVRELEALLDHPNGDVARLATILVDHVRSRTTGGDAKGR
jgi:HEAT repeat protein